MSGGGKGDSINHSVQGARLDIQNKTRVGLALATLAVCVVAVAFIQGVWPRQGTAVPIRGSYHGMIQFDAEGKGSGERFRHTQPLVVRDEEPYRAFVDRILKEALTKTPGNQQPMSTIMIPTVDFSNETLVVVTHDFMWESPEIYRIDKHPDKLVVHYRLPSKPDTPMQHAGGVGSYHAVRIDRVDLACEFIED